MRNLVLLQEQHSAASNVVDICHVDDGIRETTITLTSDGTLVSQNWQQTLQDDNGGWFRVTFCDPIVVCLSRSGAIVSVQPESGDQELVGEFDHGILAANWSPDAEVLALVTLTENNEGTKKGALLTMSAAFDVLGEIELEDFDVDSPVSLDWRPDGTFVAINVLETEDSTRRIRTYQRNSLELDSVGRSEDGSGKVVPNLHPPLSWASSGCSNLIASVQRKSKRTQQVVFFEPNGLRHREFVLRSQSPVTLLCWNILSDILAVVHQEEDSTSRLQLWHRSNYHWYLKYEWQYKSQVQWAKFHKEQPYRLFVGLKDDWREYTFCWDPSTCSVSENGLTAFAIDGEKLNFTPFHKALVPPPMYAASVTMEHCIRQVAFHTDKVVLYLSDGALALLGPGTTSGSNIIANFQVPSIQAVFDWGETQGIDTYALRHVVIVKLDDNAVELIAVVPGDRLVEIACDLEKKSAMITNVTVMEEAVLRIVNWSDCHEGALIELDNGEFLEYRDAFVVPSAVDPLLEPCPWIAGLFYASKLSAEPHNAHQERLVVGLSVRSRLYCHDRLLADAASSFVVSTAHNFLCFATAGAHCQLRSLALSSLHTFDPLMGSEDQNLEGYEPRNIERGSRLIAVLPNQPMAVLQMPRGNLEGIYPRSLVLPFVMSKIEKGNYGIAFTTMRRQKVDLNLIIDLNPVHFLSVGVVTFLEEIEKVDFLNLFISTLQNQNVTLYRYRVPSWFNRTLASTDNESFDWTSKVNQACQKLRELLMASEARGSTVGGRAVQDGYYLLPILSTFAKESPPKLEEALSMIRDTSIAQHPVTSKKSPLFSEKAQSSFQYLAFLADYELLFNTSLGMYDYDLARAVARNSQMDPKVYLPLLKRLRSLPNYFARYEVDVRLQRFEEALSNLFKSGKAEESLDDLEPIDGVISGNSFDACMNLIEKHRLHRLGLQLFTFDNEKRACIMNSLANDLVKQNKTQAALSVYLAIEPPDFEGAKKAARMCGDWRFLFTLDADTTTSDETSQIRNRRLANEVAEEIAGGKGGTDRRVALMEAARILLDYGSDIVGAIDMLISAESWSEARRLAILHQRDDLIRKVVEGAVSSAQGMMTDFSEKEENFEVATKRYVEVLKIRQDAAREAGLDGGEALDQGDDTGSLFSVASTSSLRSTGSTGSTGSVGSVASVSSVISIGNQSTFTMTSRIDSERHKSKFNNIGKKEKKKKKKGPRKNKMRPGSEEELKQLVSTLKSCIVEEEYSSVIDQTIVFLSQVGHLVVAKELYECYEALRTRIDSVQNKRVEDITLERIEAIRLTRREGIDQKPITLLCEAEVDGLKCQKLSSILAELFSFF